MRQLLDNVTTNSSSAAEKWRGGRGAVLANGTFDGCTITLQIQDPDSNWVSFTTTFTAAGMAVAELPPGNIRLTVSSAGASTNVSAWISGTELN